jgi:molybdopterin converting factor small subunit
MIQVNVRLLGGLRKERNSVPVQISLPDQATVHDLEAYLQTLGMDKSSNDVIISLSGRGITQWPPDRLLEYGEEVVIFPHISGG